MLLIEDDPRLAEMVKNYLGEAGFAVTVAARGNDGIALEARETFDALARDDATLVGFEAPRRLADALRDALAALGDRPACLARNLTKPHERYQRGRLSELIASLGGEDEVRGEVTLLIGGAIDRPAASAEAEADARLLLDGGAPARAVQQLVVARHGLTKREAYSLVLRLRGS